MISDHGGGGEHNVVQRDMHTFAHFAISHEDAAILFADIVGFSTFSVDRSPGYS